jgi:hypothetical protein
MESNDKLEQIENDVQPVSEQDEIERMGRRKFLRSLGKWSMAVISGVVGAAAAPRVAEAGWVNRRGGWINGGGGGWINGHGGWINGGGGWLNNRGGGGWLNAR